MTYEQLLDIRDEKKIIGDAGEDFVLRYEQQRLQRHPLRHLIRLAGRKDIGLGYDILSLEGNTSTVNDRYIEVKTYSGTLHFFFSQSEQAAAEKHGRHYYLYFVDINRMNDAGYEPFIVRDPINHLKDSCWSEKVQQREYTFVDNTHDDTDTTIADDSIVLVGCFNDNRHLQWILNHRCYNVRYRSEGYTINGSIRSDDVSHGVNRLVLYNVREPRTYAIYDVDGYMIVSRDRMLSLGYQQPHSQEYILYHLTRKLPTPPLDIMQILRTSNDKLLRTSGTPIYMSGKDIKRYLLAGNDVHGNSPRRIYTNTGKPWTAYQEDTLRALFQMGTSPAVISKKLYRDIDEIHHKLHEMGLE